MTHRDESMARRDTRPRRGSPQAFARPQLPCTARLLLTLRPSTSTVTKPQPTSAVARLSSTELPS